MKIKLMFVDATQFCLCKNSINCMLSMNESARRCLISAVSKTDNKLDIRVKNIKLIEYL